MVVSCPEFVTVVALWKSFVLPHSISKDLWIMQWTGSVLFQIEVIWHCTRMTLELNILCPIPKGYRGNFSLINVRLLYMDGKKIAISCLFLRLKLTRLWWKLNKTINSFQCILPMVDLIFCTITLSFPSVPMEASIICLYF